MTTEEQKLSVDLRFRPHPSAAVWSGLFDSLLVWEPRLRPTHVDKIEHYHLDEPEPWTAEMAAELAVRCAVDGELVWTLLNLNEGFAMTFDQRLVEVAVSLALPRPAKPLPSFLLTLLDALREGIRPSLSMLFDLYSGQDAEVMSQGLRGLKNVPPMLHLDAWAVERAGGSERLRHAPCKVLDMPDGGLLLITRPSLWEPPTPAELERQQSLQRYLGMSDEHPLVFIGQ